MSTPETEISLEPLTLALTRLQEALAQPKTEWTRDASIQRFEFTFELAWKTLMRFARREGAESVAPRQTLRAAFKLGWIEDEAIWFDMLDDRNLTSHTYNEDFAEELYARLPNYQRKLAELLERLRSLSEPPANEAN